MFLSDRRNKLTLETTSDFNAVRFLCQYDVRAFIKAIRDCYEHLECQGARNACGNSVCAPTQNAHTYPLNSWEKMYIGYFPN
jgi:hypothetical protein